MHKTVDHLYKVKKRQCCLKQVAKINKPVIAGLNKLLIKCEKQMLFRVRLANAVNQ